MAASKFQAYAVYRDRSSFQGAHVQHVLPAALHLLVISMPQPCSTYPASKHSWQKIIPGNTSMHMMETSTKCIPQKTLHRRGEKGTKDRTRRGSNRFSLCFPRSMTWTTSSIVMLVSAIFVANTICTSFPEVAKTHNSIYGSACRITSLLHASIQKNTNSTIFLSEKKRAVLNIQLKFINFLLCHLHRRPRPGLNPLLLTEP